MAGETGERYPQALPSDGAVAIGVVPATTPIDCAFTHMFNQKHSMACVYARAFRGNAWTEDRNEREGVGQ